MTNLEFQALELKLLTPSTRRDVNVLNRLLADDFIEFGASGNIYTKQDVLCSLPAEAIHDYEIMDFMVRNLGDETVLVTYRSRRTAQGADMTRLSLRSSLWKCIDGEWKMIFHQGTVQAPND